VSAVAIGVATVFLPIQARADCTAIAAGANTVNVTCTTGPTVTAPFSTSYAFTTPSDGSGPDTLTISGGEILNTGAATPQVEPFVFLDSSTGFINTLDGDDVVNITGGTIGASGDEVSIDLGEGDNTFNMSGGTLNGSLFAGLGADAFNISGGTITGQVNGTGGSNSYDISGGRILGGLFSGSQDNTVNISGNAFIQANPAFGTGAVNLEDGNDTFAMTGGTIAGDVIGGNGDDEVTVSGGTITGDIDAEEVTLNGGTINGDITGITGNTLTIDATALNLRDGVLFAGNGEANGEITNTDLAAGRHQDPGLHRLRYRNGQQLHAWLRHRCRGNIPTGPHQRVDAFCQRQCRHGRFSGDRHQFADRPHQWQHG
jgi:hypothetical protein